MDKSLLKYVMKDNKAEDIFHSSVYGKAQNNTGMGTTSAESFATRRLTDNNRTHVRSYDDSQIVTSAKSNTPRPKTFTPSNPSKISSNTPPRPSCPKPPTFSR